MGEQIYMALLHDGTAVWRPVAATKIGPRTYLLSGPMPDGEEWQFQPGSIVRCEPRTMSDGEQHLVAVEISPSQDPI